MKQYTQDKKYYSIECLRFVFAICIIYFHLLHSFIMPYTDDSAVYKTLAVDARYMKYIVECFFIISGYFLYRSIQRHPDRSFREFVRAKIARLWPVLACSICISMVLGKKSFTTSFLNLFFLQSSGIVSDWSGLNWYVSAFFIAEVFYFVLYKCFHNSAVMKLLILLLVCGGYAVNLFFMSGGFGRKMVYGVLNLGLARGIAGVGWGYMLGMMFEFLKNMYRKLPEKESCSQIAELGISVIEISADYCCSSFYSFVYLFSYAKRNSLTAYGLSVLGNSGKIYIFYVCYAGNSVCYLAAYVLEKYDLYSGASNYSYYVVNYFCNHSGNHRLLSYRTPRSSSYEKSTLLMKEECY
mgnify:CR=1 FL=1